MSIDRDIDLLRRCANEYETSGTSPLTDAEYDALYAKTQAQAPDHPFFNEVGGFSEEHAYGDTVKHDIIMGSLNKDANTTDFLKWFNLTFGKTPQLSFMLQHKVDGLSLSCLYKNGELQRVVTRGNGFIGIDVTQNAKYVDGIPARIPCRDEVEVRGEGYKDRKDFYENWAGEYCNPRNFTAGSINQKDPKVTEKRGLSFVAYEVVRLDFQAEQEKQKWLVDNKFNTLIDSTEFTTAVLSSEDISKVIQKYMDDIDRESLPYDIDGVVVKVNKIQIAKDMGTTAGGKKPKANRAVKFPCEQKVTVLNGVEWNVGRTGGLTPVGLLDPVQLAGTTVKRVTLHNVKFIREMKLDIGSSVLIQKSGDIIPYVVKKVNNDKDVDTLFPLDGPHNSPIVVPTHCPSCNGTLENDATDTTVVCKNISCPSQLNGAIEHWFKKIGVKGIGPGIISKLTDPNELQWDGKPIITSIPEMYYMLHNDRRTEHPFRKYAYLKDYFGPKAYQNIVDNVLSVKKMTLAKFIEALGIGQVGRTAKDITDIAPTVQDVSALTVDRLSAVEGFGHIKSTHFIEGWRAMADQIAQLLKSIEIEEDIPASNKLDGKKFCFTGSFSNPTRKEMEAMVVENGGKCSSVSKKLTALVWDGEIFKGKCEKAKKLDIPIITQVEFLKMID